jgi:Tetratricopeptide repeat
MIRRAQSQRRLPKWHIAVVFTLATLVPSAAGEQKGDLREARRLNGQVLQYYSTGQYQKAIPLARRALGITEKALGPEHPNAIPIS